jgi:hypothetical protein
MVADHPKGEKMIFSDDDVLLLSILCDFWDSKISMTKFW